MRSKTVLSAVGVAIVLTTSLFYLLQKELSGSWLTFGVHPEVISLLEVSLENQKELARLQPETADHYRQQFEEIQNTLNNLHILEHNRESIVGRVEVALLGVFCGGLLIIGVGSTWLERRREIRLNCLQVHLRDLSLGRTDIVIGDRRRDTIGRIAGMIEGTSQLMAADRARLATLQHLGVWQEAARRQAHEMRTPLTGLKMDIERLRRLMDDSSVNSRQEASKRIDSACEEVDRLALFAQTFTSFAKLPEPRLKLGSVNGFVTEFCETYADAWPELGVQSAEGPDAMALFDREMLRQVLVNLCDNSAIAAGEQGGSVTLTVRDQGDSVTIAVADNGPGVDSTIQTRLFEPYATTRRVGEGMGLGLAISKKIMLDHNGDLELESNSGNGSVFRITLAKKGRRTSS
ncbi:MAG: HAMP domain-containing histidine kinase [bacterium]|nr:HAMP domain-containing histidine kinase [bacterium]